MRGAWVVSPADGGEPYRIRLVPEADVVVAEIERGDERWSVRIASGERPGWARVDDRSVEVDWRTDPDTGRLALDGRIHRFVVRSEAAHRASRLAGAGPTTGRAIEVKAPMPGLVLTVEIEEGASVEEGQGLVVIEAMKMENEIRAPAAGVVGEVLVAEGEPIDQGATLVRIDPHEEDA